MESSGRELFTCLLFMFTDYPSQCATIAYGHPWERVVYLFVFYVYRLPLTVCYNRLWTAWERVVYLFIVYVYRLPLTVCYNRLWTALGESGRRRYNELYFT